MKRVSLTKVQAEAVEVLLGYYKASNASEEIWKGRLLSHFIADKSNWNPSINLVVSKLSLEEMISILYHGYDIQQTPEERLRVFYDSMDDTFNAERIKREAIRTTLNILEIEVEGING